MRHLISVISTAIALTVAVSCSVGPDYRRLEGTAQGGTFHIIYSEPETADGSVSAGEDSIAMLVSRKLRDIDFSISGYNHASILSRLNRGEDCAPDRYFLELFDMSRRLWEETDGLFDISGGPLFDFWGFGFTDPEKLDSIRNDARTASVIDSLKTFVGMDLVRIENGRLVKDDPRVQLNFNAIAQGYTCDVIAGLLDSLGVRNYLVEVGMEIVCKGLNASGKNWSIGIDAPVDGSQVAGENIQKIVHLTDCGITTSGNYRKYRIINGKKYAHSINPVTGYPVQHDLLSATVICSDTVRCGALSDAYATYCMVIGKEKAQEFISSHKNLRGYLIHDGGTTDLL
ncbi:MAG TPA: FAD:protein FMN transferase [Candidatus Coprenecus pullistercoris]|nr:FAD:protein FMN transferase [Candidatus Coprenecus pullistercoris]